MPDRTIPRLRDIVDAIEQIGILLAGKSESDLEADRALRAALERFLEIAADASRRIPAEMKDGAVERPWRRLEEIGDQLKRVEPPVAARTLWRLHGEGELADIRDVVEGFRENLEAGSEP